jgi:hypothetical protein
MLLVAMVELLEHQVLEAVMVKVELQAAVAEVTQALQMVALVAQV